jgi:hypothetical protein
MATTTNYGWTTPNDTDLVKDGASAIRTLGSSIDTTTKALNPSTTLGDIEYRSSTSNTNTRLPIGTTGQVLSVSGGVPAWTTGATVGPSFQGYRATSNQGVSATTWTKVQINGEDWDTNNAFDSTTNYRFTPQTPGKYLLGYACNSNATAVTFAIYKNGSFYKYFPMGAGTVAVDLNGSTDYIEFYVYLTGSGLVLYSGTDSNTAFAAYLRG